MRFFTILFLLFSFSAFAQQKILIQSIRITNNYDEVAANPFLKQENENKFLNILEQKIQNHFGSGTIYYLTDKKILFTDRGRDKHPSTLINDHQNMLLAKRQLDRQKYDIFLDIALDINDFWKGKNDNFILVAKVKARDKAKHKLEKNTGKIKVMIPAIPFTESQFNATEATVYESFPLTEDKLIEAFAESIASAFNKEKKVKTLTVSRQPFTDYASFMQDATSYRLIVRNDYGETNSTSRLFNIFTLVKFKPIPVVRQHDNRALLLGFQDRRITDVDLKLGVPKYFYTSRFNKNYVLSAQSSPEEKQTYFLHSSQVDNLTLGRLNGRNALQFKLRNEQHQVIGNFKFEVNDFMAKSAMNYARSLSRIYHPWANLNGTLEGKPFSISTNPYALNAVEIKWDGQVLGVITHAAASKKYLRKERKKLPYYVYFSPECSAAQQQLLLNMVQVFHIGHALENERDRRNQFSPFNNVANNTL